MDAEVKVAAPRTAKPAYTSRDVRPTTVAVELLDDEAVGLLLALHTKMENFGDMKRLLEADAHFLRSSES